MVIHGNQIVISISERKNNEVNSKTPFASYRFNLPFDSNSDRY